MTNNKQKAKQFIEVAVKPVWKLSNSDEIVPEDRMTNPPEELRRLYK